MKASSRRVVLLLAVIRISVAAATVGVVDGAEGRVVELSTQISKVVIMMINYVLIQQ